jgi:hypothetical protein
VERVAVEGGEVVLLPTVRGLVSEAQRVREAFAEGRPTVVALGASPEATAALLRFEPSPGLDLYEDLPDAELAYSARLQAYGEVALPPPDLMEAARLAKEAGVPLRGADLPEARYEDVFAAEVSAWGLLRYGRVQRKLVKRPPAAADARAFALAWDAAIRKVKGLDRVEKARESHMAQAARLLVREHGGPALLVVDVARAEGVLACLRSA